MSMSTNVNLPRAYTAKFPVRCVVCDYESPDSRLWTVTGTLGWWTWILWWYGSPFWVQAPACFGCAWKAYIRRVGSLAISLLLVFGLFWYIWPHFEETVPRALRRWAMMGLGLLCFVPQLIFDVFLARSFDVTAYSDSVDYEFASSTYAWEFACLNDGAAWVKVDGEELEDG